MGNCHKNRICKFFHSHCPTLLFDCYHSLLSNCRLCGECTEANNPTPITGYCEYHQRYYTSASTSSPQQCLHKHSSIQQGQPHSVHCSHRSKMHRQRSASHCPHHIQNNDRKCCCRKSNAAIYDPLSVVASATSSVGARQKRSSSLRVLNKRFNFFDTGSGSGGGGGGTGSGSSGNNSGASGNPNCTNGQGKTSNFLQYNHTSGASILRRNSRKHKHNLKLNDLNDSCLKEIFEYLTFTEKLHFRRVCRRWQALVKVSLKSPASLKIGEHSVKCNCQCAHFPSWDLPPSKRFTRDSAGYIIFPNTILLQLLTLCSNLRCINFSHCYLNDQALKIIMEHGEMIECLHLNDIRLEEENDDDPSHENGNSDAKNLANSAEELLGHEDTITAAVGAFATEQLAVFGGLMRKLSTRKSSKKDRTGNSASSITSKKSTASRGGEQQTRSPQHKSSSSKQRRVTEVSSTPTSSGTSQPIIQSKVSPSLSTPISRTTESGKKCTCNRKDSRTSLETTFTKNSTTVSSPLATGQATPIQCCSQKRATQRRREWSRHRSSHKTILSNDQPQLNSPMVTVGASVVAALDDESSNSAATSSYAAINSNSSKRHLSPSVAPNISSLQTDSDGVRVTSHSSSSSSTSLVVANCTLPTNDQNGAVSISKLDDVQAFVESEQRRRECRQTHLLQWKMFAKQLGLKIRFLSIGGLSAVDQIAIDMLLKYCVVLEELRINNEIDILSYLSIIKHTVNKIYINCEHGIGLECVSMLAYRNYAEKVIDLGRVDVPPELIDSVISTIGSNFSNLRSLHLRLHNFDIDVTTPASLLFDNLYELNLQFVSGNVDAPFKKFIQLGWSSVRFLTIQYASITEDAVRAIHENMPQLKKLVLHAIEFRCDHLAKRYGHRICGNCSHLVWKCIATLPHLMHLKLHRVIIDEEICKALCRMSKLANLELHYCSNVNDNVIGVCADLARRNPRRRFTLCILSRGFVNYNQPTNCTNLYIDIQVACR